MVVVMKKQNHMILFFQEIQFSWVLLAYTEVTFLFYSGAMPFV